MRTDQLVYDPVGWVEAMYLAQEQEEAAEKAASEEKDATAS